MTSSPVTIAIEPKKPHPGAGNNLQHGASAVFSGGRLPRGCSYVRVQRNLVVREAAAELQRRHGTLDVGQQALLQSAGRHEQRALLLQRWLRVEFEGISPELRMKYLADISKATDARDRCFAQLGLDKAHAQADHWAAYHDENDKHATKLIGSPQRRTSRESEETLPDA